MAIGYWNTLRIEAVDTLHAFVYVNDVLIGISGVWNSLPTMDRIRFMSGSTSGVGDEFYVDNVAFN
jgi:hypothetical protein